MKINTVGVWGQTAPLFKNVLQYIIPFKRNITLTLKIISIPFKYCKTFLKGVFCYLNFVFARHIHITVNFNYRVQLYVISDFFIRKKFLNRMNAEPPIFELWKFEQWYLKYHRYVGGLELQTTVWLGEHELNCLTCVSSDSHFPTP